MSPEEYSAAFKAWCLLALDHDLSGFFLLDIDPERVRINPVALELRVDLLVAMGINVAPAGHHTLREARDQRDRWLSILASAAANMKVVNTITAKDPWITRSKS